MEKASSSHDLEGNVCAICTSAGTEKLVNVTLKSKKKLKEVSLERGDLLFAQLDISNEVFVHNSCRSRYTHPINVQSYKRNKEDEQNTSFSPPKRKLRRSSSTDCTDAENLNVSNTFDWEENCCICGEQASIENEKKKRQELRKVIRYVESSNFRTNTLEKLSYLQDDFNREIYKRFCDTRDLVSLQAKYHHECFRKLIHQYEEKMKMPQNTYSSKVDQAMEEIFKFMLSSEECQFTMEELKKAIKYSDITPSENTIKQRLKNRFSDQIIFSSRMGGVTYVCFANNLYDILTDAWYNNRKQTIEEEEEKLIDSASELIRRKIRNTICRLNEYPASDKIFDKIDENIPPLLLRFLQNVIYKDKKK